MENKKTIAECIRMRCHKTLGGYEIVGGLVSEEYSRAVFAAVRGFKRLPWERLDEYPDDFPSHLDRIAEEYGEAMVKSIRKRYEEREDESTGLLIQRTPGGESLHATLHHNFANGINIPLYSVCDYLEGCLKDDERVIRMARLKEIHKCLTAQLVGGAEGLAELLMCAFDVTLDHTLVGEAGDAQNYIYGLCIDTLQDSYRHLI